MQLGICSGKEKRFLSTADAIQLMLGFGSFTLLLLTFVIALIKLHDKGK